MKKNTIITTDLDFTFKKKANDNSFNLSKKRRETNLPVQTDILKSQFNNLTLANQKIALNQTFESFKQNPENYIDSILFRSLYTDEKVIHLKDILKIIRDKANHDVSSDGLAFYKIKLASGDEFLIARNIINAKSLFGDENFKANYNLAFNKPFEANTYKSNLLSGLQIAILDDLDESNQSSTLQYEQILDFRFLTCLFFGMWFHIELVDCKCYPTSLKDWIAYNSGITKNCLDSNCIVDLMKNPQNYDPLVHFDCQDENLSYTFNLINQLGNYNTLTLELNKVDGMKSIKIKSK